MKRLLAMLFSSILVFMLTSCTSYTPPAETVSEVHSDTTGHSETTIPPTTSCLPSEQVTTQKETSLPPTPSTTPVQTTQQVTTTSRETTTTAATTAIPFDPSVQQVIDMLQAKRTEAGLPPFEINTELCENAAIRVKEVIHCYPRQRPDGSHFSTLITVPYEKVAENVACEFYGTEGVINFWMHEDEYRENILNPDFKQIGIGMAVGVLLPCWVVFFTD